jgi:acetyltransferase
MQLEPLTTPLRPDDCQQLIDLLTDCVDSGAALGFLAPLPREEARDYWASVTSRAAMGERVILVARETSTGPIIGSAQIVFETRANGRHRAEVQKVMVRGSHRRRGIARRLMGEIETLARTRDLRLLFLDTSERSPDAREFYETIGYIYAGGIPGYALEPDGSPAKNAIYYKELTR